MTDPGQEEPGFGAYTYVLIGVEISRLINDDLNRDGFTPVVLEENEIALKRFVSLVSAIKNISVKKQEAGEIDKATSNIFYIPSKKNSEDPAEIVAPNLKIAIAYLNYLDRVYPLKNIKSIEDSRFSKRLGPFLVTLPKPILNVTPDDSMLFVDLSNTNPAAMSEVVQAYRSEIKNPKTQIVKEFKSIRLAILNFVLNADDDIKIINTAVADWLPNIR
jgi:hypothetical protein